MWKKKWTAGCRRDLTASVGNSVPGKYFKVFMYERMKAYRCVSNLEKTTSLSRAKIETFLQSKNSRTKYRQHRRRFPCMKVFAYDVIEVWSFDLAYVDNLAKYNKVIDYVLVAVDVQSRNFRVQPLWTKVAKKTVADIISQSKPLKVWSERNRVQTIFQRVLWKQWRSHLHHKLWRGVGICRAQYSVSQKHYLQSVGKLVISLYEQSAVFR